MKRYSLLDVAFFTAVAVVFAMFILHRVARRANWEVSQSVDVTMFVIFAVALAVGIVTGVIRQLRQNRTRP